MSITIYGIGMSPFVRKVNFALGVKGLEYENITVMPIGDDAPPEFKENSPLGKIPLANIDGNWLPDSSVILAYLEKTRTDVPLLSDDAGEMARALWFEEYADSHMVSVMGGHLFAEVVLAPVFFNRESNLEEIELAKNEEIPAIFDYLESQLNSDYLVGDTIGLADISVCSPLVSMLHCDVMCDASRWPKTAAYIDRLTAHPVIAAGIAEEKAMMSAMLG